MNGLKPFSKSIVLARMFAKNAYFFRLHYIDAHIKCPSLYTGLYTRTLCPHSPSVRVSSNLNLNFALKQCFILKIPKFILFNLLYVMSVSEPLVARPRAAHLYRCSPCRTQGADTAWTIQEYLLSLPPPPVFMGQPALRSLAPCYLAAPCFTSFYQLTSCCLNYHY